MILAIDVGNTHTVFGVRGPEGWQAIWRRGTGPEETEDQLAVWLRGAQAMSGIQVDFQGVIIGSVVPQMDAQLSRLCDRWLRLPAHFLRDGASVGLRVDYDPPHAVGADRIANALGALAKHDPPIVVVDFGTATTFDAIDASGAYMGGAILPGVALASQALVGRTAKLPQIELTAPPRAIGRTTVESLQSGMMLGYAGAIDALARRMQSELGSAKVVATGGLGQVFADLCESIEEYDETLTLDGLAIAYQRLIGRV